MEKKAVRRHAARQPRPQGDLGPYMPFKSSSNWNRYQARTRLRQEARANTFVLDMSVLEHPQGWEDAFEDVDIASTDEQSGDQYSKAGERPRMKTESSSGDEQATSIVPRMQDASWAAPFEPLGALKQAYYPLLIEHYLTNLATEVPELEAGHPFILRTRWFPMVIANLVTLNIVLLTSASHYVVFHQLHHDRHIRQVLLRLKYQTLTCINRLVHTANQNRGGCDDAVIGAVAKMASYEAMFGVPELYHMHMRGLQNMIRFRGGLETLGLDGLLQRMVLWVDVNSASLLKSSVYFVPNVPLAGHVAMQRPNPSGFLGVS